MFIELIDAIRCPSDHPPSSLVAAFDEIVDRALTRLEELHRAGTLKVPPALSQRLASVEIESGLPALRKRAAELRKAIR